MKRIKVQVGDLSEGDTERAVLPTILFASDKTDNARAAGIAIGWWKWGIRMVYAWKVKK